MQVKLRHAAAAAAVVGFLGFGGVSLAYAQASGPSTTAPSSGGSTTAPAPGNHQPGQDHPNCPNMGGSTGSDHGAGYGHGRPGAPPGTANL